MRIIALVALAACSGTPGGAGPSAHTEPDEKFPAGAADCSAATLVTGYGALADATGTAIAVEGVPVAAAACTLLECTDDRACCNACGGQYVLHDAENHQVSLLGLPGCTGMDCNMVCDPFGKKPTRAYRFVGVYDDAQRVLQVEKFCAVR